MVYHVFKATFNNKILFQLYRGAVVSFRKPEYLEKTTNLLPVTDKLYHKMLYQVHLVMNEVSNSQH
jgi:hypothetical protein